MSGGSFDYMYLKRPVEEAFVDDLQRMVTLLQQNGMTESKAHDALTGVMVAAVKLNDQWRDLEDLAHAIEWWQSADWSLGQVVAVVLKMGQET